MTGICKTVENSRNNLLKVKYRAYIINLNGYKSIGTHWIASYVNDDLIFFGRFGVEHIPKEIKQKYHKNTFLESKHKVQ